MAQLVGIAVVLYGVCLKAEKELGFEPTEVEFEPTEVEFEPTSGDIHDVGWFDDDDLVIDENYVVVQESHYEPKTLSELYHVMFDVERPRR